VPVTAARLRTAIEPSLDGTVIVDLHVISSAVTIEVRETDTGSRCADTAGDHALREPVPVTATGLRAAVEPGADGAVGVDFDVVGSGVAVEVRVEDSAGVSTVGSGRDRALREPASDGGRCRVP